LPSNVLPVNLQETFLHCGQTYMQGMRLVTSAPGLMTIKLQTVAEFNKECLSCVNVGVNDC
jgi:hypothetical protein